MSAPVRLAKKDLLSISDLSPEGLSLLLKAAVLTKAKQKAGEVFVPLLGKTLALIFHKPSARTRISFDVGMYQLGGHSVLLTDSEIGLGKREPVKDIARLLSRLCDGVMIRTFDQGMVEELAAHAAVPVINGLTDFEHPCQILADLLTLQEKKGALKGLKVAYVGDGNNVANSWALAAGLCGVELAIASPKDYTLSPQVEAEARGTIKASGMGKLTLTTEPAAAVKGADAVYTDVWTSMGQEDEREERLDRFSGFQINHALMSAAKKDALVLHCLPAHRGEEIDEATFEAHQATLFDQAENRLHAQKALLVLLMGGN
jgi:ornithine carbamoyltransferase